MNKIPETVTLRYILFQKDRCDALCELAQFVQFKKR